MVNKWDIYYCSLDPAVGSEQKGIRPVMIISTDSVNHRLPVSTVLPLSSVKPDSKIYPTEVLLEQAVTGLPKLSVAMVHQIRTISHKRLNKRIGSLVDVEVKEKILEACRKHFDL